MWSRMIANPPGMFIVVEMSAEIRRRGRGVGNAQWPTIYRTCLPIPVIYAGPPTLARPQNVEPEAESHFGNQRKESSDQLCNIHTEDFPLK